MNINGKVRISNKWDKQANAFDRASFEFQIRTSKAGKDYGYGKLSWSDKDGDKFKNSNMRFVAFGDAVGVISNNLGGFFNIEGKITVESFKGDDGNNISYSQITIFQAESLQSQSNSGNAYIQEVKGKPTAWEKIENALTAQDDDEMDEIPF